MAPMAIVPVPISDSTGRSIIRNTPIARLKAINMKGVTG
jgi:hypothetical protein